MYPCFRHCFVPSSFVCYAYCYTHTFILTKFLTLLYILVRLAVDNSSFVIVFWSGWNFSEWPELCLENFVVAGLIVFLAVILIEVVGGGVSL